MSCCQTYRTTGTIIKQCRPMRRPLWKTLALLMLVILSACWWFPASKSERLPASTTSATHPSPKINEPSVSSSALKTTNNGRCEWESEEVLLQILGKDTKQPNLIDSRLSHQPYVLDTPITDEKTDTSEHGQPGKILELLGGKKNGTFFEAGAYDGEFFSNSLLLERKHGWTGLLVESSEVFFQRMVAKNRKAILLNACVSPCPWFQYLNLTVISNVHSKHEESKSFAQGYLDPHAKGRTELKTVECYPLYSILAAANLTTLDVLMLDMQGPEVQVLRTLPWSLVDIKMVMLEISAIGSNGRANEMARREKEAMDVLERAGYTKVAVIKRDFFFMKKDHI